MSPTVRENPSFAQLLETAVSEPGKVSAAYRQFHNYSLGNQLLAAWQCAERGIAPGPLATFPAWKALGRHVKKGEKAMVLCMPVTCKRKADVEGAADAVFTRFVYKPNWFALSQTEGADVPASAIPGWDATRALAALDVREIPFDMPNGNILGYAIERRIAINPVNPEPERTRFHEIAHILLGHTAEVSMQDGERTPRDIREVEAESVAMLCCAALGLPGVEYSRGYIQHWYGQGRPIPEASAQKVLKVTDQILKAGRE